MIPTTVTIGVFAVSLLSGIIAVAGIVKTFRREADAQANPATGIYVGQVSHKPPSPERSQHKAK